MKKTLLRLAIAIVASFIMVAGFAPEETYAVQGECMVAGCSSSCSKKAMYCHEHECSERGCHYKATNRGYCNSHAPKSYSGSYSNSKSGKSSSSYSNTSKSKSKSSSSYGKSSSSKKRYYDMPDCDDYEDYDDFMDDWDGCMPDDSDAEDYWDNW